MPVIPVFMIVLALAGANVARAQGDLIEDASFLSVTIGNKLVRLEALTVRRAAATGRLPIALIAHGKPVTDGEMSDMHAQGLAGQARDLARRGWLAVVVMRRGFGASDGPQPVPSLPCTSSSLLERFNADADDLAATLSAIAQRSDADGTRMIAIGVSAGGSAVTALSARNPPGLAAVINVSGAMHISNCPEDVLASALVSAFHTLGLRSRVPSLWIFAENDSLNPPSTVEQMRAAFLAGGGSAKLVMLGPEGKDGHQIFVSARMKWLMEMDGFLRFLKLPTWTRADVYALMRRLGAKESDRRFLEGYIAGPLEKALAREKGGTYMHATYGWRTIEEARRGALGSCQRARPACELIMENDRWLAPPVPPRR